MPLPDLIESHAAKLRELHEVWVTFRIRDEGDAQREAWSEACRRFHSSYDELAFPGGLSNAMSMLPAKNPTTIEVAVRFLESDPWFFRSGYIKAELMKHLRRVPLSEDQRIRLQQVILARVREAKNRRELRWYCRLARVVTDRAFEGELRAIGSRHAEWVLAVLTISPNQRNP
jgi:hypothetical protein